MVEFIPTGETLCMARTPRDKAKQPRHFLRQWREYRGLSLEQVTDRLRTLAEERPEPASKRIGATHGNLSRIERGKVPYSQPLLELLADIYATDAASLIMRNPTDREAVWSIWDQIEPTQRPHAEDVLRTFIHERSEPAAGSTRPRKRCTR